MSLTCKRCWTQDCSRPKPVKRAYAPYDENFTPNALVQSKFSKEKNLSVANFLNCLPVDELIRQVTINCTERGLLLLRIRDEIAMSMQAYDTLYCSSVAFGLRKALQSEDGKEKLFGRVTLLEVFRD